MSSNRALQRPPVTTIAFWSPPRLTKSRPCPQPSKDTAAWYYSLADKVIKSLQLRKHKSRSFFFVVLETTDDSLFQLELSQPVKDSQSDPNINWLPAIGTLKRISDISELPSALWIKIELPRSSKFTVIDMRFILSFCCGAFTSLDASKHKSLFALALTASVARKGLPVHSHLIGSTGTVLDNLWKNITPFSRIIGQSFWEKDIADQRRNEVREWVFKAARDQLDRSLVSVLDGSASSNFIGESDSRRQAIAASVADWLEFEASKQEAASLIAWDGSWNETWNKKWDENWRKSWTENAPEAYSSQFGGFYPLSNFIPRPPVTGADGKQSGSMAGRAAIEVAVVAGAVQIPDDSILASEHAYSTPSTRSRQEVSIEVPTHSPTLELVVPFEPSTPNWLECWRSIRYPNSRQKWLQVWEAASNMAWALAWEKAGKQDKNIHESEHGEASPQGSSNPTAPVATQGEAAIVQLQTAAQDSNLPPDTAHNPLVAAPIQHPPHQAGEDHPDTHKSAIGAQNRSEPPAKVDAGKPSFERGIVTPDLEMLSKAAWNEAKKNPSCPEHEANLREWARNMLEQSNRTTHVIPFASSQSHNEPKWDEIFIATWEKTWRQCWESAWLKVMNDTTNKFWDRRSQEGVAVTSAIPAEGQVESADPYPALPPGVLESYEQVKQYLAEGRSQEELYWRIRSMFKALDLLHKALAHSIPASRQRAMEIVRYMDGSVERAETLTHAKFQQVIESLIKDTYKLQSKDQEDVIDKTKRIWQIAIETDSNSDFMDGKDPEPRALDRLVEDNRGPPPATKGKIRQRWSKLADSLMKQRSTNPGLTPTGVPVAVVTGVSPGVPVGAQPGAPSMAAAEGPTTTRLKARFKALGKLTTTPGNTPSEVPRPSPIGAPAEPPVEPAAEPAAGPSAEPATKPEPPSNPTP